MQSHMCADLRSRKSKISTKSTYEKLVLHSTLCIRREIVDYGLSDIVVVEEAKDHC